MLSSSLSPQSPLATITLPAPQSNCLNFRLIIRWKGREQYLNVPSFEDISNLYKIGMCKFLKNLTIFNNVNDLHK